MWPELLEAGMILAFGLAWPASIAKSLKARSAKGKSIVFLFTIALGYCCGIGAKFASGNLTYVLVFYAINLFAVCIDTALYFRNHRLDRLAEAAAREGAAD